MARPGRHPPGDVGEPTLVNLVQSGTVTPTRVLSHVEPMPDVIRAYQEFDQRRPGWIKVELLPQASAEAA